MMKSPCRCTFLAISALLKNPNPHSFPLINSPFPRSLSILHCPKPPFLSSSKMSCYRGKYAGNYLFHLLLLLAFLLMHFVFYLIWNRLSFFTLYTESRQLLLCFHWSMLFFVFVLLFHLPYWDLKFSAHFMFWSIVFRFHFDQFMLYNAIYHFNEVLSYLNCLYGLRFRCFLVPVYCSLDP